VHVSWHPCWCSAPQQTAQALELQSLQQQLQQQQTRPRLAAKGKLEQKQSVCRALPRAAGLQHYGRWGAMAELRRPFKSDRQRIHIGPPGWDKLVELVILLGQGGSLAEAMQCGGSSCRRLLVHHARPLHNTSSGLWISSTMVLKSMGL
jgi:hypothetical protein